MAEALFVSTKDHTGTPRCQAACQGKWVSPHIRDVLGTGQRTNFEIRTVAGAAAQVRAPATFAVLSYFTIQGILVATWYHRSSALFIFHGSQR